MKRIYTSVYFVMIVAILQAQTPAGFSYQAVIRDASGELVKNKTVGMQISILQNSPEGEQVFSEVIFPTTNINGLVTVEIGKTNPAVLEQIDWSEGSYYLKTETDPNGGTNYSITGTSQLLSVPYAMYATESGNGLKIVGTPQAGDILFNNGESWSLLKKGINGQTLRLDNGQPKWAEPGFALPMVTTSEVSEVIQTSAKSGGNVIATGFTDITARGVCWSTNQNPTTADSKTTEGTGVGTFTSKLTNLLPNTTYYARAYATNEAGTAYGNQVSFKTFLTVVFPTVTTAAATNITSNAVTSGGNVTETGGAEVTAKGICWSTNQNPTTSDSKTTEGDGTGQFTSQAVNLLPGTTYYIKAYATNNSGTGYGNQVTITTTKTVPVIATKAITEISAVGCVTGGSIIGTGGSNITDKGICWGENPNPTIADNVISTGEGQSAFTGAIFKGEPKTTYYVRAYAKNELGIGYGEERSFITLEAAYFQSFESGTIPAGWSGCFSVANNHSFEGTYSFQSLYGTSCDAKITLDLLSSGIVSFYFFARSGGLEFYIDDVKKATYPGDNSNWQQGMVEISAGKHTLRWQPKYHCSIDYIVISK